MSNKEAVIKLLKLLEYYKKYIAVILICLVISTGFNLCIPLISSQIMDEGFINGNKELLMRLILVSLVIYTLNSITELLKEKKRIDISSQIQFYLSEKSFTHLMKLEANYFSDKNYTEILDNIKIDIGNMTSIADEGMFFVVSQVFSMIGGIVGLLILDYRMTILVLLFIPIKYIIMKMFAQRRKQIMDSYILESQNYSHWFGDTVAGVREVKCFGILKAKLSEFTNKQMQVIKWQKKMNMLAEWNNFVDIMLIHILITMLYVIGANLIFNMQLSVGNIFAFITYSSYVTGPISAILNIGYLLSGIIPSTKRYYEFMDMEEENDGNQMLVPEFGDIEFRQVSFAYHNDKPIIENVNLIFPKGSKTALIGKNGSGKSTIIDLLLRMYTPTKGMILLAGDEILNISLDEYRNMFSVVSQDIYLFNDTIRNNISLYKQVEDKLILDACKDSGLFEFIEDVSLDYMVGQNGTMLSGGQKQKIALARALIHDRPIVVFDEVTSSTDACSEQQINALLHTRLKYKTVIVITHKEEILNEMNQVVILESGKVNIFGECENVKKSKYWMNLHT
ncbi:hypothetical protein C804_05747 [Lachnospiraceae bacterium A4]|jgi:ATP-binding cassette subfamily B protein|nr:hypothetical protein C804_05747 [Lachnospiraceae bacterium A4]